MQHDAHKQRAPKGSVARRPRSAARLTAAAPEIPRAPAALTLCFDPSDRLSVIGQPSYQKVIVRTQRQIGDSVRPRRPALRRYIRASTGRPVAQDRCHRCHVQPRKVAGQEGQVPRQGQEAEGGGGPRAVQGVCWQRAAAAAASRASALGWARVAKFEFDASPLCCARSGPALRVISH
jgi:hypothetical protein